MILEYSNPHSKWKKLSFDQLLGHNQESYEIFYANDMIYGKCLVLFMWGPCHYVSVWPRGSWDWVDKVTENAMAPHSSTLAWQIPWTEEPGRLHGVTRSQIRLSDFTFTFHFPLSCIGEGSGNPLQCSCLENPRDGGAWWAAVFVVAQSWTRLKRLSSSRSSRQN